MLNQFQLLLIICAGILFGFGFLFEFPMHLEINIGFLFIAFVFLYRNIELSHEKIIFLVLNFLIWALTLNTYNVTYLSIFLIFQSLFILQKPDEKRLSLLIYSMAISLSFLMIYKLYQNYPWNDYQGNFGNNVISAYSIFVLSLLTIQQKNNVLTFVIFLITLTFLAMSYSKTGWLLFLILSICFCLRHPKYIPIISLGCLLIGMIFYHDLKQMIVFKAKVSGFLDDSSFGHFYDRYKHYQMFYEMVNNANITNFLFGFNSSSLGQYAINTDKYHSLYLEIFALGGFVSLLIFIIRDIFISLILILNDKKYHYIGIAYFASSFVINITSSISLKYNVAIFLLPTILCYLPLNRVKKGDYIE